MEKKIQTNTLFQSIFEKPSQQSNPTNVLSSPMQKSCLFKVEIEIKICLKNVVCCTKILPKLSCQRSKTIGHDACSFERCQGVLLSSKLLRKELIVFYSLLTERKPNFGFNLFEIYNSNYVFALWSVKSMIISEIWELFCFGV